MAVFTFLAVTIQLFLLTYNVVITAPTHQNGFSFASYYADHMVLQKSPQKANVWGYSTKIGDSVYITVNNNTINSTVITQVIMGPEGKGVWKAALPAVDAGGPYTVTATSSLATLVLHDVLFGDVWICSGQSNMQFTLTMDTDNSTQEIKDSVNFPNIRVFTVALKESDTVRYDLINIQETWSLPNKESLGGRVWSHFSSLCWHYGKNLYKKLNYPIGLIASDWGGTIIESWSSPDASAKCGSSSFIYGKPPGFPRQPHVLWNSMINPLLPFTIYGVIWYQGESNSGNPVGYNCSFPAMIDDWRVKFNKESGGQTSKNFPFGFVQLGPSRNNATIKSGFPDIRVAQTAGYGYVPNNRMKNVFMALALDLPDFKAPFGGVHPRHKAIVANRLTLGAMSVAYHRPGIMFQGPYPSKIINSKKTATITIHYATEISVKYSLGFEICCTTEVRGSGCGNYDKSWHGAQINTPHQHYATIRYPSQCLQGGNHANAIRYLWNESPCAFEYCAIYSHVNNLPAPPFQQFLQDDDHHIVG